jgi:hypothetical protein
MRRRLSVMALLILLGMAATAGTALAHDTLASSDPVAGSTLTAIPHHITLTFNEDVDPAGASIKVVGPAEARQDTGAAVVVGGVVVVELRPHPANGSFSVQWRVVSDDGHPVSGQFSYTLAAPAIPAPAAIVGQDMSAITDGSGLAPRWPWFVGFGSVVLLGGAAAVRALRLRHPLAPPRQPTPGQPHRTPRA